MLFADYIPTPFTEIWVTHMDIRYYAFIPLDDSGDLEGLLFMPEERVLELRYRTTHIPYNLDTEYILNIRSPNRST